MDADMPTPEFFRPDGCQTRQPHRKSAVAIEMSPQEFNRPGHMLIQDKHADSEIRMMEDGWMSAMGKK